MSRVKTNNTGLSYVRETALGVADTTGWRVVEPNGISNFGPVITSVSRRPISKNRARSKGTITTVDSTPEYDADLTLESFMDFAEGFVSAEFANVEFDLTVAKLVGAALDVTATGYALGAALSTFTNGTLLAGKVPFSGTGLIGLFLGRGYAIPGNNGLKPLTVDLTGASTEVVVSGLAVETAPANAAVVFAGVRVDDITLTISGSTATLSSLAEVTDWSALGFFDGMEVHLGSDDGSGGVQNGPTATEFGYARVASGSGTGTLNLDKLDVRLTGGPHTPANMDVMHGRYLRNLAVDQDANDSRFLELSYQFEQELPDLGGAGLDEFEYARGNVANQMTINLPLTDKATATFGFVGQDTEGPLIAASRKAGASAAISPLRRVAINTGSDIASLSTDLVSAVGDVCFKSVSITLNNNASPEKCLGEQKARFINTDLFEVNLEAQMLFTDKLMVTSLLNNSTVTFQSIMRNSDGAISIDLPELTLGSGGREYPVGASVLANLTGETFNDSVFDTSIGITVMVGVPLV